MVSLSRRASVSTKIYPSLCPAFFFIFSLPLFVFLCLSVRSFFPSSFSLSPSSHILSFLVSFTFINSFSPSLSRPPLPLTFSLSFPPSPAHLLLDLSPFLSFFLFLPSLPSLSAYCFSPPLPASLLPDAACPISGRAAC